MSGVKRKTIRYEARPTLGENKWTGTLREDKAWGLGSKRSFSSASLEDTCPERKAGDASRSIPRGKVSVFQKNYSLFFLLELEHLIVLYL